MILTDDNFMLFAARSYNNPQCLTMGEFKLDVRRIFLIKKLCAKFKEGALDISKVRILLNNIIIMNNIFGPSSTNKILYLKAKEHFDVLKPMLIFIGILPEEISGINSFSEIINTSDIEINLGIVRILQQF